MGSSGSKAAGAAARQYPKRPPPTSNPSSIARNTQPNTAQTQAGPTVKPAPRASTTRDAGIDADASDPDLARHLRQIGPVQPNPTFSQTSTFNARGTAQPRGPDPRTNPAILILDARARLQEQADKEIAAGGRNDEGRQFLDAWTIRQILVHRDQAGKSPAEIEKSLGLKSGVVARLGPKGVLGLVTEVGRANKEVDLV